MSMREFVDMQVATKGASASGVHVWHFYLFLKIYILCTQGFLLLFAFEQETKPAHGLTFLTQFQLQQLKAHKASSRRHPRLQLLVGRGVLFYLLPARLTRVSIACNWHRTSSRHLLTTLAMHRYPSAL
jgi:hypothetical protein